METAISWEIAAKSKSGFSTPSGMPEPIAQLFQGSEYGAPVLLSAVAEHKVKLPGGTADSQCDVWAIVKTSVGLMSLTVEAKANESFGDETLETWLKGSGTDASRVNRDERWAYLRSHLPPSSSFAHIRYQLLHRCASAVIEAERYGFTHAAFVVQAFGKPTKSLQDYDVFCNALGVVPISGRLVRTSVNGTSLSIGWADCPLATPAQVLAAK